MRSRYSTVEEPEPKTVWDRPSKVAGYSYKLDHSYPNHYVVELRYGGQKVGHIAYHTGSDLNGYRRVELANIEAGHTGKGLYQEMIRRAASHVRSLGGRGVKSLGFSRSTDAERAWLKLPVKSNRDGDLFFDAED